ncbi:DUF3037 domain-containing protein [Gluconacetobacter tumulicola]|uniref:DUF3037 domain-containing protein n=1 Tax=Gluconacetobacter tumulicola TaxID=1017177 RepID=A0A7W4P8G7_9PROT|nr:DUF3037 domain-containing protein [Gluconacetobacter tumulicola]MBB2181242.1 DUF3037 domain-containing protein [Gluconacetobacter tumulicola]
MTGIKKYSYVTLRYCHDSVTREFVNIGVVVFSSEGKFLKGRYTDRIQRVTALFPNIDRDNLRHIIRSVKSATNNIIKMGEFCDLFSGIHNAETVARRIIINDDSALRWSPLAGGISTDLEETTEHLFERFVTRYQENIQKHRRTDHEVFTNILSKLNSRNISNKFKEKTIRTKTDEIDFKLAWKNGKWHCLQPLSFDLSDGDHIRDKARKWTGHLLAVSESSDEFTPYFVVAKPNSSHLQKEFDHALSILKKSPVPSEIILEEESDLFISKMAEDIFSHEKKGSDN